MAVTKRIRYEVLRRDEYTCQYCGAKAPGVQIQVDHVKPKSLGGKDTASNLVAAYRDCNYGKSSSSPDSSLVEAVSARNKDHENLLAKDAVRHVAAATRIRADWDLFHEFYEMFILLWHEAGLDRTAVARESMYRWWLMGIPDEVMGDHIPQVARKVKGDGEGAFRYFASIMWNLVKSNSIDTGYRGTHRPVVYTDSEHERIVDEQSQKSYHAGYELGKERGEKECIKYICSNARGFLDPAERLMIGLGVHEMRLDVTLNA